MAAIACLVPEVGPHRFWLAGILVGICVPGAVWLERHYPVAENGWSEPLFDLTVVVTGVHLVPQMWVPALVIGLMVVQAPSIGANPASFLFYGAFALILTVGMAFAAIVHDVPDWEIPIALMALLYPSVIAYSFWQARRASQLRERARKLEGLQLVAGGFAHDFNNLLTGVMGHTEIAIAELADGHPARRSLDEVLASAQGASRISQRLLAFSGRGLPGVTRFDVEEELRELVALLRPMIAEGVTLDFVSRFEGGHVHGDRARLQQAMASLILDTSEASDLPLRRIEIHLEPMRWTSGERESPPVTRERSHALGIDSARRVVAELGGNVAVENAGVEALRVRIELPAESADVPPARAATQASPGRGSRALVIDDEAPVRRAVSGMLTRLGYEAIAEKDGDAALARFREDPRSFGVVLLDLRMPGMDGWACLGELQQIRSDVPVILCSGYDPADGDPPEGPVRFLAKPFGLDSLREALDALERGTG